jgi:hypothetical protein
VAEARFVYVSGPAPVRDGVVTKEVKIVVLDPLDER